MTIRFNGNGASGTMKDQVIYKDTKLSKNTFKWTGHTFLGWSTDKDATVTEYANSALFTYDKELAGQVVELYAVWR